MDNGHGNAKALSNASFCTPGNMKAATRVGGAHQSKSRKNAAKMIIIIIRLGSVAGQGTKKSCGSQALLSKKL